MFNNNNHQARRRPAPRVPRPPGGTLRALLYQLAYISSGAAVGVAALCAEERRRRTALVQRIADNASRLRQSPRHVHNAALAYVSDDGPLHDDGWAPHEDLRRRRRRGVWAEEVEEEEEEEEEQSRGGGDAGLRLRRRRAVVADVAAAPPRGPELPSVVEKGYEQVAMVENGRRVRRQGRSSRLVERENGQGGRAAERGTARMDSRSTPGDLARNALDSEFQQYRRGPSVMQLRKTGNEARLAQNWTSRPQPEFLTLESGSGASLMDLARKVERDVGLFFEAAPWTRRGLVQERRIADHLFTKALECGVLAEIRSIFFWKLAHDLVSEQDLGQLCHACQHLGAQNDKHAVLDLYVELFGSAGFQSASARTQLHLGFEVVTVMMLWDFGRTTQELIALCMAASLVKADSDELHEALERFTTELLAQGQITGAADLIVGTSNCDNRSSLPLADKVFDAASAEGSLSAAGSILQWKCDRSQRHARSISQYEWFIHECGRQKAYPMLGGVLRSLERHGWFDWLVPRLSSQARLVLATACTAQLAFPRNLFRRLYEQIPPELADTVAEYHDVLRLQELWNATRDVTAVKTVFEEARDMGVLSQSSDRASERLLVTMIEILLSANQPDQAIDLLLEYHPSQLERNHVICLTAVALAKKKAWKQVDDILVLLENTNRPSTNTMAVQHLHPIVHLFSRQHTAAQSWSFATGLVERFGFVPTKSTTESLLQCFVSNGSFEYIPQWLDYVKTLGVDFKMDGKIAAKLLQRLYLCHRPPHIMVMSFCRNLIRRAPWLDEAALAGVIRESIAFDMRTASGKNKALIKSMGEQKLAKLEQADKTGVPAPSYNRAAFTSRQNSTKGTQRYFGGDLLNDSTNSDEVALDLGSLQAVEERDSGQALGNGRQRRKQLEDEIILAFSQDLHKRVLGLYESSLDGNGRPLSPFALEVAVESALRLDKGNVSKAKELLSAAQKAGMNVSCAMGPMLTHEMYHLDPSDKKKLDRLRVSVIDYYRSNEANGWTTRHHIGVTAANILIDNNRPLHGIDLLNAIYSSEWTCNRPLDIVAMTVYVKGYAAVRSMNGLQWVVQTVLRDNLRIDRNFTAALKKALPYFDGKFIKSESGLGARASAVQRIRQWRQQCIERQELQRSKAKLLGQKLVECIVQCSKPELEAGPGVVPRAALEQVS